MTMANPDRGEIKIQAGGRDYIFRLGANAIRSLEKETGKGFFAIVASLGDKQTWTMDLCIQMMWAGLHEKQPELTIDDVGNLLPEFGGLLAVNKLFDQAFRAAWQTKEESGTPHPRKADERRNGIGLRSSASGAAIRSTPTHSGDKHPNK